MLVDVGFHFRGDRLDESVRHQDPEERSDESGGDVLTDDFVTFFKGTHGDDNAQDGGDDPETGHGVTDSRDRRWERESSS